MSEPGPTTEVVGSVVDRALVRHLVRDHGIEAIVHGAARHKPHIETHDNSEFVAVNVQGTLNLLEEAVGWDRRSTASSSPRPPR